MRQPGRFPPVVYILIMPALALSMLLSAFVGSKDVGVTIMMVSLGFGFPLLFAPTPIPYLVALAPLALANRAPLLAIAMSCLAVGAIGVLPGLISRQASARLAAQLAAQPTPTDIHGAARKIEIHNPDSGALACDRTCHNLLLDGSVDWVRFVFGRSVAKPEFYVVGHGKECRLPLAHPVSECVVFAVDSGQEADLIIENQRGSQLQPNDASNAPPHDAPNHRIIATLVQGEQKKVVFDKLDYDLSTIHIPTLIGVHFNGMSSGGFELLRDRDSTSALSTDQVFEALGFHL
jgi:hypothetical protein